MPQTLANLGSNPGGQAQDSCCIRGIPVLNCCCSFVRWLNWLGVGLGGSGSRLGGGGSLGWNWRGNRGLGNLGGSNAGSLLLLDVLREELLILFDVCLGGLPALLLLALGKHLSAQTLLGDEALH